MTSWQKSDWRAKPRIQMPVYTNTELLKATEKQLGQYPPLVFAGEARSLRQKLAAVSRGEASCSKGETAQRVFKSFQQITLEILLK